MLQKTGISFACSYHLEIDSWLRMQPLSTSPPSAASLSGILLLWSNTWKEKLTGGHGLNFGSWFGSNSSWWEVGLGGSGSRRSVRLLIS